MRTVRKDGPRIKLGGFAGEDQPKSLDYNNFRTAAAESSGKICKRMIKKGGMGSAAKKFAIFVKRTTDNLPLNRAWHFKQVKPFQQDQKAAAAGPPSPPSGQTKHEKSTRLKRGKQK